MLKRSRGGGISTVEDSSDFTQWLLAARQIRLREDMRVLGLVPVTPKVGLQSVLLQLGRGLCSVAGAPVTLLDLNCVLPAFRELVPPAVAEAFFRVELSPGVWAESIAVPLPRFEPRLVHYQLQVARFRADVAYVICDFTGLQELSVMNGVLDWMDGVVSVAPAGRAWEWSLTRLHGQFPREKDLGVLFVDSRR